MSGIHVARLREIRAEYLAALDSVRYVERNWDRHDIYRDSAFESDRSEVIACRQNLERTYITRLFSAFEGVLREHLAYAHPDVSIPKDPKVSFFVARVRRVNRLAIDPAALDKIDRLRLYRNSLTHPGAYQAEDFTLDQALSILNHYVAKIP